MNSLNSNTEQQTYQNVQLTKDNWLNLPAFQKFEKTVKVIEKAKKIKRFNKISAFVLYGLFIFTLLLNMMLNLPISQSEILFLSIGGALGLVPIIGTFFKINLLRDGILIFFCLFPQHLVLFSIAMINLLYGVSLSKAAYLVYIVLFGIALITFGFLQKYLNSEFDKTAKKYDEDAYLDDAFVNDDTNDIFRSIKKARVRQKIISRIINFVENNLVSLAPRVKHLPSFIFKALAVSGKKIQRKATQQGARIIYSKRGIFNLDLYIKNTHILYPEKLEENLKFSPEEIEKALSPYRKKSNFVHIPKNLFVLDPHQLSSIEIDELKEVLSTWPQKHSKKVRKKVLEIAQGFIKANRFSTANSLLIAVEDYETLIDLSLENNHLDNALQVAEEHVPNRLLEVALEFEKQKKLQKAYQILEDTNHHSDAIRICDKLGNKQAKNKRYDKARDWFEKALSHLQKIEKSNPEIVKKHALLEDFLSGVNLSRKGKYSQALDLFKNVENEETRIIAETVLKANLAECYEETDNFLEAKNYFKALSDLVPDPKEALIFAKKATHMSEQLEGVPSITETKVMDEIDGLLGKFKEWEETGLGKKV